MPERCCHCFRVRPVAPTEPGRLAGRCGPCEAEAHALAAVRLWAEHGCPGGGYPLSRLKASAHALAEADASLSDRESP